ADAGDAATLSAANAYTDNQIKALVGFDPSSINGRLDALEDRFDDVDRRLHRQDRRIDRQGAMASAMLNMAINAAGTQSTRGRVAVGAGWQGGEAALSVGYGRRIGKTASFSIGGAFSGSEKSAGIGFGVDL
ncbi:YadA-like protein, partial [Luteimonas sp. J16]|uniref:YadA-like family protein n=2 Tax=unclassified Luteimonas TaxID=2629088 RepID=UPI0011AC53C0